MLRGQKKAGLARALSLSLGVVRAHTHIKVVSVVRVVLWQKVETARELKRKQKNTYRDHDRSSSGGGGIV